MNRILPLFAVVACASAQTPTPTPTPENTARNTAPIRSATPNEDVERGSYVGRAVGIEIRHFGGPPQSKQTLPEGLEALHTINVADGWHWTVARHGADLTVLLIDENGVVADDVTMRERGDHTIIVGDCPDAFVAIAPANACAGVDSVDSDIGWGRRDRTLERLGAESCNCDLVNLDEE